MLLNSEYLKKGYVNTEKKTKLEWWLINGIDSIKISLKVRAMKNLNKTLNHKEYSMEITKSN